jgi:hypothetical protein
MSEQLNRALDDVLSRWAEGESLQDCLARYPEHADQLRPLISTAAAAAEALRPVQPPSRAALERGRQRFLEQAAARKARRWLLIWPRPGLARAAAAALVACLLLVTAGWGLVAAAADSLPGSALYPVKRLAENARLWAESDPAARERLHTEFARERRLEVQAVLHSGKAARVEFEGALTEVADGSWTIGGLPVTLTDATRIEGEPAVGRIVWVSAQATADGRLLALRLRVGDLSATPTPDVSPQPSPTPSTTRMPGGTPTARPSRGPATPQPTDGARGATPAGTPRRGTAQPTGTGAPPVTPTPYPTGTQPPTPADPTAAPSQTGGPRQTPPGGPSQTPGPPETPPGNQTAGPSATPRGQGGQ